MTRLITLEQLRGGRTTISKSENPNDRYLPDWYRANPKVGLTHGESLSQTEYERRQAELVGRIHQLEKEWQVLNTRFFSYSNARNLALQREIAQQMDAIETELGLLRPIVGQLGRRMNGQANDGVQKTDRARGRDALATVMHTPTIAKAEDAAPVLGTMTSKQGKP